MRPRPNFPSASRLRRRFRFADSAQQLVGGFLLAGPFVVTEEVWVLATGMSQLQAVLTVALVGLIGYGALYQADTKRDPGRRTAGRRGADPIYLADDRRLWLGGDPRVRF